MRKVLVLMVALVALAAIPAVASAQSDQGCENSGGQPQGCDNGSDNGGSNGNSGANASGNGGGGSFRDNTQSQSASAGACSNISQQQAIGHHIAQNSVQHNACANRGVVVRRFPVNRVVTGVRGTSGVSSGVSGVSLARTGFDAWILVVIGGVALAGGLGILTVQRRMQLS
jgi:LPXTG-motif cell wall-anchored protein